MSLNHSGTMTIETERLILRKFNENDLEDIFFNWANNDEVTKYLSWFTHTDINQTKKVLSIWIENYQYIDNYNWAIQLRESDEVIGNISLCFLDDWNLSAEVGYCLSQAYWGNGYMTESSLAVLDFCFNTVQFNRITGCCIDWHENSIRVLKKCGMKFEGIARQKYRGPLGFQNFKCYAILKEDWSNRNHV